MQGVSMVSWWGAARSAGGRLACGAAAAVLLGAGVAGCGGGDVAVPTSAAPSSAARTVVVLTTRGDALASAAQAADVGTATRGESRARRLAEFRRMIVREYSVPGDGSPAGHDPLRQLSRALATTVSSRVGTSGGTGGRG